MSYGSTGASDRGLGVLPGNTLGAGNTIVADIGARLTNNSGGTLSSLPLAFVTEVWLYQGAVGERFVFEYSTDATSLTTGTWTAVPALDVVTPTISGNGKKDGNTAANRVAVAGSIPGLDVAAGADLWIRWRATNQSGNDNGLAIDDLVFGTPIDNAPTLLSSTPAGGATDVPVATAIALTFSEAVTVDAAGVALACGGNAVPASVSGNAATHTVTPNSPLPFGVACQLDIAANAVADVDGTPQNLAAPIAIGFTTVADLRPTLAWSVPADESTDFPANANLQITFSEAVTLGASWFDIFCGDSGDRVVGDAVVTGGPTIWTINPNLDFQAGETCELRLNASDIADQDGVPDAPVDNIFVDFTPAVPMVNQPPAVLSTTPMHNGTGFPSAGDIVVLFSEAVTLQPGAFALTCTASSGIVLGHANSGTSFTIDTGTALVASDACTFTIDRTKVQDSEGANPAADTVVDFTVAGNSNGAYYSRVNTSSAPQLRCSLHETIKGHTKYPYGWDQLELADEDPNDAGRILDIYRNCSFDKPENRDGPNGSNATCAGVGGLRYNREHVWPNSLGFANNSLAAYTDLHMLHLSDKDFNAHRGNSPYDYCPQNSGCSEDRPITYNGDTGGNGTYPGNSNWYDANRYEVWHRWRGNMARAIFYMAIRYEGIASEDAHDGNIPDLELTDNASLIAQTSNTAAKAWMGILQTLLEWHAQDPVDARELERNQIVFGFQGNRNPFVDHPEWATRALFESTQPASCVLGGGNNTAPVAVDDGTYGATEDTQLTVPATGVLANDTDAQSDPLSAVLVAQAAHGTVALAANGGFTYQPAANYCGSDEFTYRASDGIAQSVAAAVARIAVTCVNDAPVASDAVFALAENSIAGTAVGAVVATDVDAGQTLAYAITAGNAAGAFAIDASTGAITVANATPLNFEATPQFLLTVTVTDNGTPAANDGAMITINLDNVEEGAAVANDDLFTVDEDSGQTALNVLANDVADPDTGALAVIAVGSTQNAAVGFTASGLTYAPNTDFCGTDTVTYTVSGGDLATVTVNVTCLPEPAEAIFGDGFED